MDSTQSLLVSKEYKDLLLGVVDRGTGEITELEITKLDEIQCSPIEKQNAIAQVFKFMEIDEKELKAKIDEANDAYNAILRKKEAILGLLASSMRAEGISSVKTAYFEAKFKKNPPRVVIDSSANVDKYTKITAVETVDKAAIKHDLLAGIQIPGCRIEQGERLELS